MKNKLILFTADFPFGTGETFLETEIKYLAEGFDEVLIISQNSIGQQTREIPPNCEVKRINLSLTKIQKLLALFNFFDPLFWKERSIIKSIYHIPFSKGIITTKLISLTRGRRVKNYTKKLLTEEKNDNKLYFYSYWCDDAALGLAMLLAKNKNVSCICRMHGWDVYFEVSEMGYLPFRHYISKHLKALFAISKKGIEYAENVWKVQTAERFFLARLGVLEQNYQQQHFPVFSLVSCSNVIPLKRIHLIVEALSKCTNISLHWYHFGTGTLIDSLKDKAAKELPANVNVSFMGQVNNLDLMKWYTDHQPNVFINVSSSEGIPVSIMEAMSFGIPAIASNVGGTAELVNERNGILMSPNPSPNELFEAISFFYLLSIEQSAKFSIAAKETWENEFNAEKNYSKFAQTIISL